MADIFISYAREDAAKVERLAPLLTAAGYSAWWDRNLTSGSRYLKETEAELKAAKAVLVIWSKASVESHWVADEAAVGRDENRLAAISFDGSMPPLGFRQFQVTDFSHWKGGVEEPPFASLVGALARLVGSSGAATPFSAPTAGKPIPRRTLIIGGIAAAGVAVITAVAMFAIGPQASQATAPASQRVAFFGFTPTSDEPAAKALALAATDQMFETMGLFKRDSAARDETLGTPPDTRLTRAAELGSLYALSGEVRPDTDGMTLSIRFVDVPSRTTLWEQSFSGPASEAGYLPAQAAWPANGIMRCFVSKRTALTRDSPQLLGPIADRCREGFYNTGRNALEIVSLDRALAQADPGSAGFQAGLALNLISSVAATPASARPALIAEAEALLARATELDPQHPLLMLARVDIAGARAVPLAEYDRLALDSLAQAEGKDAFIFSQVNRQYTKQLLLAGRLSAALPYASALVANDPGQTRGLGGIYGALGQSSRARADYEMDFVRNPTAGAWGAWTFGAIFLGAGAADEMLNSPPSFVPKSVVACFSDIRKAYVSKDLKARSLGARRASECGDAGDLTPVQVLASLAALGDLAGAFVVAGGDQQKLDASHSNFRNETAQALWWPTSRAMRADPRFLPLVEKLGLMEYWRATKSQPDACETEDVPFCRELKTAAKP
jgi:TolB-like protein